jgi:hypothetical protein
MSMRDGEGKDLGVIILLCAHQNNGFVMRITRICFLVVTRLCLEVFVMPRGNTTLGIWLYKEYVAGAIY